ncbi:methylase involved in ubiquinone/menaquinone biosynthesis [Xenococcus sp. PCC 7305]|uniref:class I SAM-dependent methyltransferase n=1 Tax=Xenococcus sp. PCC 7305 TaxID=102125 RepID=UPI0002AC7CE4|nr:class I SAM-dependent methyltransferase [Xenococcus sp. PCC 7305]ELS01593.1 methylase involved in ubiquinone/menaquinone biosynthesis [Xenococcus sp. PCC 7305]
MTKNNNNLNNQSITPLKATQLQGEDKRQYIRTLFDNIATKYDFIRTIVFLGQTSSWYRQALRDLELQPGMKVLDVGCGTGESTRFLTNSYPDIEVEGLDLSPGMLEVARQLDSVSGYFEGDVCNIERPDATYDLVITAFTFRNFPDKQTSLAEMIRVLRPGGRLLILDHFQPQKILWKQTYTFWMSQVVPQIVKPFIEDSTPYRYLAQSIINQLSMPEFTNLINGFGATVTQANFYGGGASGRLIAVRN